MSFSELGICPEILEAIEVLGFETPSPIQEQAIPPALSGADILGLSHTGSGKTLAFSIPALESIDPSLREVQVLCLAPTRELAVQICREVDKLALFLDGVSAVPIYGGASFAPQLAALKRGVQFVVGTPGRVIDLMEQGELKPDHISMLILDEANEPQEIAIERPQLTVPTCEQLVYEVVFSSRIEVLSRLIEMGRMKRGLVFANTKRVVDDIVDGLLARGYAVDRLHGDMPQTLRERVMDSFRKGNLTVLVATDIAARGLDIDDVDTVVNFELPRDPEDYVHRIGRTARAGRKGRAVSFIGRRDFSLLGRLERFVGVRMQREKVMTGVQVEEVRRESLVDEILENAAQTTELPEELSDIDMPAEQLLAAMFNLLVAKTSRELQPIPEDRPSKFSRAPRAAEDGDTPVEKGNDWSSLQQSVTLFMNGGKLLGLRPKDIAGLFYNEGGAPKGTVGDIRLFLKHSLIEVTPEIAPQLIERLGTCNICGYEVNVREDKGRPAAGGNAPYEREFRPRERERRGASYSGRGNGSFRRERDTRGGGSYQGRRESGDRNERSERVFYDKFSRRPRRRD